MAPARERSVVVERGNPRRRRTRRPAATRGQVHVFVVDGARDPAPLCVCVSHAVVSPFVLLRSAGTARLPVQRLGFQVLFEPEDAEFASDADFL